jgi:hypothetical protein
MIEKFSGKALRQIVAVVVLSMIAAAIFWPVSSNATFEKPLLLHQ